MQIRKTDNKNSNLVLITRHIKDDITLPTYTTYYAKLYEKGRKNPRLKKIGISTEQVSLTVMRERCRKYLDDHGRFGRSQYTLDKAFKEIYIPELQREGKKTIKDIKRNFYKDISPHWGSTLLSDIESPALLIWFQTLTKRTPGGANHCLSILKSLYTQGMRLGICKHNPCLPIKKNPDNERTRSFSDDELLRFRMALKDVERRSIWAWSFIMLSFLTGARKGELAKATWGQYKDGIIVLDDHKTAAKTKKQRVIYLNEIAVEVIERLPRRTDHETILKIKDPRTAWLTMMKQANIKNFTQHDLRHHFASTGLNLGLDLIRTASLTGHKSLNSMKRYQRPSEKRMLQDTKLIENALSD